jgi:hypothetical protein
MLFANFPICNLFKRAEDLITYHQVDEIEKKLGKKMNVLIYLITTISACVILKTTLCT